ncbi:MAG: DUF3515 domain-containing protein [Aeromicrobium sp.]
MGKRLALRSAALLTAPLLMLGGCTYGFSVDAYPTTPKTTKDCDALYADLPNKVAGEKRRDVKGTIAAAWGDPAIILRCAVEKPDRLDRVSRCDTVENVDWFTETTADGLLFTTIGRTFYISVEVPKDYDPPSDALVDLAKSVVKHDPSVKPCV